PTGRVTPGVVSSVGKVATTGNNPTITVTVTLNHPKAAGTLDQAPVTVSITTATAPNALVVPVNALLARAAGGDAGGGGGPARRPPLGPGRPGVCGGPRGAGAVPGPGRGPGAAIGGPRVMPAAPDAGPVTAPGLAGSRNVLERAAVTKVSPSSPPVT